MIISLAKVRQYFSLNEIRSISMTIKQSSPRKKIFGLTSVLVGIAALGVFLATGGFIFAASQEAHDPFCASCHTQPKLTFFQRSTDAQAVDLAAYHTAQKTRCIDCHSGQGVWGRMAGRIAGGAQCGGLVYEYRHSTSATDHPDSGCQLFKVPPGCDPERIYTQVFGYACRPREGRRGGGRT